MACVPCSRTRVVWSAQYSPAICNIRQYIGCSIHRNRLNNKTRRMIAGRMRSGLWTQQNRVIVLSRRRHCHRACYDDLDQGQRHMVDAYLDILLDWNTRMNLTAIRDRQQAIDRHVNDSLAILPALDACVDHSGEIKVIDIGSGAGLPGLVIAMARPLWHVCLLDSLKKRCSFTTAAVEAMGLKNVDVVWSRAEDAGRDENHREVYDIATARAVAEVRVLAELCLPCVRLGGHWVAPKGPRPEEEIQQGHHAIKTVGGNLETMRVDEYSTPSSDTTFTVLTVEKHAPTPDAYPRKPGSIKKKPL